MKRILAAGDIHGALKALVQTLDRASYNPEEDEIIFLGDVADGWPEVAETFEHILSLKNYVYIIGNHDVWLRDYLIHGHTPGIWTSQGGDASIRSYRDNPDIDIQKHISLLKEAKLYHVDEHNNLYVHGGFDAHKPIEGQRERDLTWDRSLIQAAVYWESQAAKGKPLHKVKAYNEVFIGHTTTSMVNDELKPLHMSNVWDLDQGAGWEGKLTIMDVQTHEYWQSDMVKELYPDVKGR